eukprot:g1307.t1
MLRVYRASGDCLEIPLAAWRSTDHSDSAFLPPSRSRTSTSRIEPPELQEGHDLPPDDPHEEDAAVPPAIPVSEAREIVARYLSRIQGCNVPSTLCFLVHNDPEDCEKFGEVMHDDELVAVLPFSTGEEPHQGQDPPPPDLHQAPSLIIKTLHIPNIYNALQDAASLAEAREIVYHMTETELNQSFYRIFRYWGRVGINLLQGCLRGHGPLAWKTSQIQALLEDPRFRRWRELDGITMSGTSDGK